jgi:hypothetical protein
MSKLTFTSSKPARIDAAMVADFFLDGDRELQQPVLRSFDVMWREQAVSGKLPGRQHMAQEDMIALLPHLMMMEVSGEGDWMRFRARLVGQHHVEMNGGNAAGQFLDEAANGGRIGCVDEAAVIDVVESKTPLYVRYRMDLGEGRIIDCEGAIYPLASDGMNVDRVVALVVPHYPRPTRTARLMSWF